MMTFVLLLSMLMILVSTWLWPGIWSVATNRIDFWTWIWPTKHYTLAGTGLMISRQEKLNFFRLTGLMSLVLLMWKCMGLLLSKNHLLSLSFLNFNETLTLSTWLKLPPRKLELSFVRWRFSKLIFISKNLRPCMEYCYRAWGGGGPPSCYLDMSDKLQKWVHRTVGSSLSKFSLWLIV